MSTVNETNRYSFGKIHIRLNTLSFFPTQGSIFIKISLPPFSIESKRVRGMEPDKEKIEKLGPKLDYSFKQDFYIPIHNRYSMIRIQIINTVSEGWLRGKQAQTILKDF